MPFEIINPAGKANIILISEHASNHVPDQFNNLGLTDHQLSLHIALDIGIGNVTRALALMLDAPAIIAQFSRLIIDANRALDQEGLIPQISDGHHIFENQNLTKTAIDDRINNYHTPFHQGADQLIKTKATQNAAPMILNLHSFTPVMDGQIRPWQAGMLWHKDPRLANALNQKLSQRGFMVGDNKPYSGAELNHTMNSHGCHHGYPHVNIEIRQDLIDHQEGVEKWAEILAADLKAIRTMPEMADIKHY